MSLILVILVAGLLAALLAGDMLVLWKLFCPRRRGMTPHCRRCDYNLTGLAGDCCPECGTEMTPANVVYGEKVRRVWSKVLAGVGVVLLVLLAGEWSRSYDWYRLRTTAGVLSDLQSSKPLHKSTAWKEIQRRVTNGSLSESQHARLIDVCLLEQGAKAPLFSTPDPLIEYLGPCLLGGLMSSAQRATFFQQVVRLKLVVRSPVAIGQDVPLALEGTWALPDEAGICAQTHGGPVHLDGQASPWIMRTHGEFRSCRSGMMGSCTLRSCRELSRMLPPGQHVASLAVRLEIVHRTGWGATPQLLHRRDVPLTAAVEVVAVDSPRCLRLVENPSLQPVLQGAIKLKRLVKGRYQGDAHEYLEAYLDCSAMPVSVSFEVLVRGGGRERQLSTFAIDTKPYQGRLKTVTGDDDSGPLLFGVGDRVDVVLRTCKEPALQTVGMFEIWQGELVYPNVEIEAGEQR
jgi:hypothetical protein